MRLEQEHFVPAQTDHQTHYLYRHLSSSFYANASVACSSSSSDSGKSAGATKPVPDIKTQHVQSAAQTAPAQKNNVLHVLWMGSEIKQDLCVCVSVLVCFQAFFGTRRFILLNEYCPPSLAFQKDLACFCCLLCWHHFSEISKKQLTSYCCVLWRKRGAPHRKSNLFGAVVYESTSRTLL